MQSAEKTYAGYTLTVRNRGGHSSKPRKDNAIYDLMHVKAPRQPAVQRRPSA